MDNVKLGLFRLVGYEDRKRLEEDLNVSFADIYDALDDVRTNVRRLEKDLDTVFYGSSYGKTVDDPDQE